MATATQPTTININLEGYKTELKRVINALQNATSPGSDKSFGTPDDQIVAVYDYGNGIFRGRVSLGVDGAPGARGTDDDNNGVIDDISELGLGDDPIRVASRARFTNEFNGFLPADRIASGVYFGGDLDEFVQGK